MNGDKEINDWVLKMASNVDMNNDLSNLGDEWANRSHTIEIIQEFIYPYINDSHVVAEIGVGGGRIAKEVVNRVAELHCYDVSSEMIKRSKNVLKPDTTKVVFTLLNCAELQCPDNFFDFIYSFDVFPHVDLVNIYSYLREIKRTLKPGGKCFISTSDITTAGGFERFQAQTISSVGGFCWTSPDAILTLIKNAGLSVIKIGERREDNVYLHRDFLVIVGKDS
jgi:ubiquinone/menaquinone biosynthesis C-methylase UbiE